MSTLSIVVLLIQLQIVSVTAFSCYFTPSAGSYCDTTTATVKLCPAGSYSASAGVTACTPCEAGSYYSSTGAKACTPCAVGSYSPSTGAAACVPCEAGSYSSSTGAAACTPCAGGTAMSISGAASTCPACPTGSTSVYTGGTYCTIYTLLCSSDSTAHTISIPCTGGSYCRWTATGNQKNCVVSPKGFSNMYSSNYQNIPGNPCKNGYYGPDGISCAVCPAGSYCPDQQWVTTPTPCPVNTYSASTGSSVCAACPIGQYTPSTGSSACIACGNGTFLNQTSNVCQTHTSCPPGYYVSTPGNQTSDAVCSSLCYVCTNGQVNRGCLLISGSNGIASPTDCDTCPSNTCGPNYFIDTSSGVCGCTACKNSCGNYMYIPGSSLCTGSTTNDTVVCKQCEKNCSYGEYIEDYCTGIDSVATPRCRSCTTCTVSGQGPVANICDGTGRVNNQVCGTCPSCASGSYLGTNGSCSCTNCSVCPAGKIALPASGCYGTKDTYCTSCAACPNGTYISKICTEGGQHQCSPCNNTCPVGQYLQGTCSGLLTSDTRTCAPCFNCSTDNKYTATQCPGNGTSPTDGLVCKPCGSCPVGKFISDPGCDIPVNWQTGDPLPTPKGCSSCSDCNEGEYIKVPCNGSSTSATSRTCEACDGCGDANYISSPCSGKTFGKFDRNCTKCSACSIGKYISGCNGFGRTDSSACVPCMNCQDGSYISKQCPGNGTNSSERTCSVCKECFGETYMAKKCNGSGLFDEVFCPPCVGCGSGMYISSACNGKGISPIPPVCAPCGTCGQSPSGFSQWASTPCNGTTHFLDLGCKECSCAPGYILTSDCSPFAPDHTCSIDPSTIPVATPAPTPLPPPSLPLATTTPTISVPPNTTPASTQASPLSTGAIIGIAIGAAVVVGGGSALVFYALFTSVGVAAQTVGGGGSAAAAAAASGATGAAKYMTPERALRMSVDMDDETMETHRSENSGRGRTQKTASLRPSLESLFRDATLSAA